MNMEMLLCRLAVSVLAGASIALAIKKYVLQLAVVTSDSMRPPLKKGDWLVVSKVFGNVNRGDILVFCSKELGQVLVKRVVGLPGDNLVIDTSGKVSINDEGFESKEGAFHVPEGKYFLMGDNRELSLDSRSWKEPYVPLNDVIGKVVYCIYPLRRI